MVNTKLYNTKNFDTFIYNTKTFDNFIYYSKILIIAFTIKKHFFFLPPFAMVTFDTFFYNVKTMINILSFTCTIAVKTLILSLSIVKKFAIDTFI